MPPPRLAILLPPSEGKAVGGRRGRGWDPSSGRFGEALGAHRAAVAAALASAGGGDERVLGVRGDLLTRAQSANVSLVGAPTLPAGSRYTGVVWEALHLPTLPPEARRRASTSIAVVSGLHGLVGVDDPIPDYRLKMGASLPGLGKLSTWWRLRLAPAADDWMRGRFVVDLLPNEHRAAWLPPAKARGVTVQFVERSGSRVGAPVGHDAKAAKGRLARHLLLSEGDPRNALASWQDERFELVITPLR